MIRAYDKIYLERAQAALGRMLDYAVYDMECDIDRFFDCFIRSGCAQRFGCGDCSLIVGRSGVELAWMVWELVNGSVPRQKPRYSADRSPEYWAGWALAYFQWFSSLNFQQIAEKIPLHEIVRLYAPYHEMDIRQFCDKMTELYRERTAETNLKQLRQAAKLTQKALAAQSGIPLRTIQQYEQRQKKINKAQAETVIALARALGCGAEDLLEW